MPKHTSKLHKAKKAKSPAAAQSAAPQAANSIISPIERQKLPSAFRLTRDSLRLILLNRKAMIVALAFYVVFQIILASGLAGSLDISELKQALQESFTDSQLVTGVTLYGALLTTIGSASSDVASVYQAVLFVIFSLIFIYIIRHAHAQAAVRTADAFYKSAAPLIPFLLVLGVIALQLIPLLIANFLYSAVFVAGLAVTLLEQVLWGVLLVLLLGWTFYMLAASTMALYIVTLPDVRPLQALRSARQLVKGRRIAVLRKLLFLPIVFVLAMAIIVVPTIILAAPLTSVVFFLLVSLSLPLAHSYLYSVYRRLL